MTSAERLDRLKTLVQETEFLSVRQIMNEFGVSRSSAMRDLDELERQGVVVRQRGGAVLKNRGHHLTKTYEPKKIKKAERDRFRGPFRLFYQIRWSFTHGIFLRITYTSRLAPSTTAACAGITSRQNQV